MKFGIIKERKTPPDRRVVFTPEELVRLQKEHPKAIIKVESSDIRVFNDEAYRNLGIEVADDISDCDVFFGVSAVIRPVFILAEPKDSERAGIYSRRSHTRRSASDQGSTGGQP